VLGELSALAASLAIAASAVICRSLAVFITARPLQTMRAWSGGIFLFILFPILGKVGQIADISPLLLGFMACSALLGVAVGDTLYMKTLSMVEASRSFPTVRGIQIISTMIVAALLFDEKVSWATGVGAIMLMGGIYLAAFGKSGSRRSPPTKSVQLRKWLFPALVAGLCWTGSFAFMNVILKEVDPIIAQTFRLPFAAVILTTMTLQAGDGKALRIFQYKRKTLVLIILGGVLSYGIGVIFELYAVSFAGMAKAAILTSWTPLFILILSAIFLKEKITIRLALGILLCSGGTVVLMAL
jgi:drug/metabolite transporter (DMT)-like permease